FGEDRAAELVAEWLRADAAKLRMIKKARPVGKKQKAEPPWVVIANAKPPLRLKDHMIVRIERRARINILFNPETSRHAKMADQRRVSFELRQNIFGAPTDRLDPRSRQAFGETRGKGKAQILAAQRDARKTVADQCVGKTAANGFDFRQFRHGATVALFYALRYALVSRKQKPLQRQRAERI